MASNTQQTFPLSSLEYLRLLLELRIYCTTENLQRMQQYLVVCKHDIQDSSSSTPARQAAMLEKTVIEAYEYI